MIATVCHFLQLGCPLEDGGEGPGDTFRVSQFLTTLATELGNTVQ